jgi:nucleolar protein 12
VDLVDKSSLVDKVSETGHVGLVGDPKLSVFVGNLDFASKEEDLRVFFEGVVGAGRTGTIWC